METVELAYEELGAQNSIPLLILHGFFASSRNWRRIAEKLADSYRVFLLDLRNHGNSPHHPDMDYPGMALDVLRFMDSRQLKSANILGHSMGGKVAMWLALNQPGRIDKLIVVDIAPKTYSHRFDKMIQALIDLPLSAIQNRKQADAMLEKDIPDLSYRQFLLQNLVLKEGGYSWRIDLAIFKRTAANIVAFPEIQNFAPYGGETLFIAGGDSAYVAKEDTAGLFPVARLETIANAGHWLHVQQPNVLIEKVENFLQRG